MRHNLHKIDAKKDLATLFPCESTFLTVMRMLRMNEKRKTAEKCEKNFDVFNCSHLMSCLKLLFVLTFMCFIL